MGIIYEILPPVIYRGYVKAKDALFPERPALFDGDDALFIQLARRAKAYGEYGVGASTRWVYCNTQARILAVDTSLDWINHVVEVQGTDDRMEVRHVDLGPLGDWGWPLSYTRRAHFGDYVASIWQRQQKPDLVLVDGRLRVACFLYSLLNSEPGCNILFDDYIERQRYHWIEEIVPRAEVCGRQSLFVTPREFDRQKAADLLEKFLFVLE